MISLEKSMYYIPNRYVTMRNELFVSFNLAPIPVDMEVTSMALHVPLPPHSTPLSLVVTEISAGWTEEQAQKGHKPPCSTIIARVTSPPGQQEIAINLLRFQEKWRFHGLQNHGVSVKILQNKAAGFSIKNPPYLIVNSV